MHAHIQTHISVESVWIHWLCFPPCCQFLCDRV